MEEFDSLPACQRHFIGEMITDKMEKSLYDALKDEEGSVSAARVWEGMVRILELDLQEPVPLQNIETDCFDDKELVFEVWNDWIKTTAPQLPTMCQRLVDKSDESSQAGSVSPSEAPSSHFWKKITDSVLLRLRLGGIQPYKRLYSSVDDGLAFELLSQALLSFAGPTLLLFRTGEDDILAYCTDVVWKDSTKWQSGDSDSTLSALFVLAPSWRRFPLVSKDVTVTSWAQDRSRLQQYLHVGSVRTQSFLRGLAVGGVAIDKPRLLIPPSFENCQANSVDTCFESGTLLDNIFFDIQDVELWSIDASSYDRDLAEGQRTSAVKESQRQQIARVIRSQFLEDVLSGSYTSKAFAHRNDGAPTRLDVFHCDEARCD